MAEPDDIEARELGLELIDASRIYEGYLIPRYVDRKKQERFPPYRRAIIGLAARQRRFLRAAYTLADAGMVLEAVGPLRSMLEYLICQNWLAADPDRNWKVWMKDDHGARDVWRERSQKNTPKLYAAAVDAITPEQLKEAEAVAAGRAKLETACGAKLPTDAHKNVELRAAQAGMTLLYDGVYRYMSNVGVHPSMLATELLMEQRSTGLMLCSEPTTQFVALPVYLQGASFLYEALQGSAELTPELRGRGLAALGVKIRAMAEARMEAKVANWRDLAPGQAFEQP